MTPQEEREFVAGAFQKLKERGWFPGEEFQKSAITEQEMPLLSRSIRLSCLLSTRHF